MDKLEGAGEGEHKRQRNDYRDYPPTEAGFLFSKAELSAGANTHAIAAAYLIFVLSGGLLNLVEITTSRIAGIASWLIALRVRVLYIFTAPQKLWSVFFGKAGLIFFWGLCGNHSAI